jgi:hypothetical protein
MALVGWSTVCADDGFYVIPAMKGKYAPVPKTGQTDSYGVAGSDGDLEKGVAWPTPRFTDNGNGTVTDNLTRLIWTKNANMFGTLKWQDGSTYPACEACATLNSAEHGLTDGSVEGNWRLPNRKELESIVDCGFDIPALPNTLGTGKWTEGNPFLGVKSSYYWSSSTYANRTTTAWSVYFGDGTVNGGDKSNGYYVWCVRGGP